MTAIAERQRIADPKIHEQMYNTTSDEGVGAPVSMRKTLEDLGLAD